MRSSASLGKGFLISRDSIWSAEQQEEETALSFCTKQQAQDIGRQDGNNSTSLELKPKIVNKACPYQLSLKPLLRPVYLPFNMK